MLLRGRAFSAISCSTPRRLNSQRIVEDAFSLAQTAFKSKNYRHALVHFTTAALDGVTAAKQRLGVMYLAGYGCSRDSALAARLFLDATLSADTSSDSVDLSLWNEFQVEQEAFFNDGVAQLKELATSLAHFPNFQMPLAAASHDPAKLILQLAHGDAESQLYLSQMLLSPSISLAAPTAAADSPAQTAKVDRRALSLLLIFSSALLHRSPKALLRLAVCYRFVSFIRLFFSLI